MKKNRRIKFIGTLLALFVIIASVATAENSAEADNLFTQGRQYMNSGQFAQAVKIFEQLEGQYGNSDKADEYLFSRGKALYYLGEVNDSRAAFGYFTKRFNNSKLLAHAYFFLGNCYYLSNDVAGSVEAYTKAFAISGDQALDDLLKSSLTHAFRNAPTLTMGEADFINLTAEKKCTLFKILADEYQLRGENSRAADLINKCGDSGSLSSDLSAYNADEVVDIALLLPFSGELASFGQSIYDGAVIAAEYYRQEHSGKIRLTPYDTKGDQIEAARLAGEMMLSSDIDIVVGPLTSQAAAVTSAVLSRSDLPLIAPAATEAGLTRLSDNSFQLSPNIELEGYLLAEYAINYLKADSAVIISSSATEHIRMSRAFATRFEQLGGQIVAVEYFRSRDKDFGTYIRDIKGIVLGQSADSTFYVNPDGDTLDWDIVPVHIDCMFITGGATQLRQLVPQIHFYNLNGAYLGSDGWGDNSIYQLADNVTKQSVFTSPFLESLSSDEYLKLAAAYDNRFGQRPQRLASLGYDAVRLVTMAVQDGNNNRRSMAKYLKEIKKHPGASGVISFGEFRENIEMPFYRIINGSPLPYTPVYDTTQP